MVDNRLENLGVLKVDEYVEIVRQVWHNIHPRRTAVDYLLHVLDHASKLGEAVRRDDAHRILRETAETASWLFAFVAKLEDKKKGWEQALNIKVSLSMMIWGKYPNLCPHCFERAYILCKGNKSGENIAADIAGKCKYCLPDYPKVERRAEEGSAEYNALRARARKELKAFAGRTAVKRPKTLKKFEEMFRHIYESNVALSTIESIGFHVLEEAGEIGRAVIDAYTSKEGEPQERPEEKRQALCDEVAEVFAWLCSLTLKVQMGAATFDRYRSDSQPEISPRLPPRVQLQDEGALADKIGLEEILWITYRNPRTKRYGCPYCGKKRRPSYPCKCSLTFAWDGERTKNK